MCPHLITCHFDATTTTTNDNNDDSIEQKPNQIEQKKRTFKREGKKK